jgi:hypothetical protein
MIPSAVKQTVQDFVVAFGVPDNLDEDSRRAWVKKLAQTVAARHTDRIYGNKARTPDGPIAGDILASAVPFEAVDLLTGSADSHNSILQWVDIDPATLVGQAFVSVMPYDWLVTSQPPVVVTPPVTPPAPAVDLTPVLAKLGEIGTALALLRAAVDVISARPASSPAPVVFPTYSGTARVLGFSSTITLNPK